MPSNRARDAPEPTQPLFQGHKHRAPAPSIVNVMMSKNPPSLEQVYGPCWPLHLNDDDWNVLVINLMFHRPEGDPGKPEEDYWIKIASAAYWSGLSMSAAVAMRWHEEDPQSDEGEEDEEESDEGEDHVSDTDADADADEGEVEVEPSEIEDGSVTAVSTPTSPAQ